MVEGSPSNPEGSTAWGAEGGEVWGLSWGGLGLSAWSWPAAVNDEHKQADGDLCLTQNQIQRSWWISVPHHFVSMHRGV